MHICQTSVREAVDVVFALGHPAVVQNAVQAACADGLEDNVAGLAVGITECHLCAYTGHVEQKTVDGHFVCHCLAVDFFNNSTGEYDGTDAGQRAALDHLVDFCSFAGIFEVVQSTEGCSAFGCHCSGIAAVTSAGMAYVELSEQFAHKVGEVEVVIDVGEELAVERSHFGPVDAVHVGDIEAFGFFADSVFEHIAAFSSGVEILDSAE